MKQENIKKQKQHIRDMEEIIKSIEVNKFHRGCTWSAKRKIIKAYYAAKAEIKDSEEKI
jgi:hypothetical protein